MRRLVQVINVCSAILLGHLGTGLVLASCGPSAASKPILRQVDQHVQLACEGLAQAVAEQSGADAKRIIATTCAVESITRTMREMLLSQQIDAAQRAGVAVPAVTSDTLEVGPADFQDAE